MTRPKRKHSAKGTKIIHQDSSSSETSSEKGTDLSCDAFVGNIPKSATKIDVERTMSKFGNVVDVMLFDKARNNPVIPKFAFVNFDTEAAALKAIEADGRIILGTHNLHTEFRKPKGSTKGCIEEPNEYWHAILQSLDWKQAAAVYAYRTITMEDYLAHFIAVYAGIRGLKVEKITDLENHLIRMSDSVPNKNLTDTLPPHLAAMVYNMIAMNKKGELILDILPILHRYKQRFRVVGRIVEYIGRPMTKTEAVVLSNKGIVEGIFIYFFAKFNKSNEFLIRYPFYAKSEPIRTVLITVTGQRSVNYALHFYFDMMKKVFAFNQATDVLKLAKNYYDGEIKDLELAPYKNAHVFQKCTIPTEVFDAIGTVESINADEAMLHFKIDGVDQKAVLKRKDFKGPGKHVRSSAGLHFNADLLENETWACRSAWIPGEKFVNIKGRITKFDKHKGHGMIQFTAPYGTEHQAYFEEKVFYDFKEDLEFDDVINLDVKPDKEYGFKATLIWIGSKPDEKALSDYAIERKIGEILVYNAKRVITGWDENSNFVDAPACLRSVVGFALDEDFEKLVPRKLIDEESLNCVFSGLKVAQENQKMFSEILEKETRKIFVAHWSKLK